MLCCPLVCKSREIFPVAGGSWARCMSAKTANTGDRLSLKWTTTKRPNRKTRDGQHCLWDPAIPYRKNAAPARRERERAGATVSRNMPPPVVSCPKNAESPGRNRHLEPGPVTRFSRFADRYPRYPEDLPHKKEAEPGIFPEPTLKDPVLLVVRNPRAVIFRVQGKHPVIQGKPDSKCLHPLCIPEGIVEQVVDYPLEEIVCEHLKPAGAVNDPHTGAVETARRLLQDLPDILP